MSCVLRGLHGCEAAETFEDPDTALTSKRPAGPALALGGGSGCRSIAVGADLPAGQFVREAERAGN